MIMKMCRLAACTAVSHGSFVVVNRRSIQKKRAAVFGHEPATAYAPLVSVSGRIDSSHAKIRGIAGNGLRRHSPWKKGRLFACSAISTSLVAIMAVVQGLGCIDNVLTAVLWLLVTTAGLAEIFS